MDARLLAIDQGTTSTRAIVFDAELNVVSTAQEEFAQHFPAPGWVEHDPEDLWRTTLSVVRAALQKARVAAAGIAAIGIANQRETTIVWDRESGQPVGRAIVWQDRRTAGLCGDLRAAGLETDVRARTGLVLDPYFSATKIKWLLNNVAGARARAAKGALLFGTVDSFLLWRLTGGAVHATDATNASRTLLYGLADGTYDDALLGLFDVPRGMLPEIRDSAGDFGATDPALFGGRIRIAGVAGDQQAATVGQACFRPGMIKSTYGTGAFALFNLGTALPGPDENLLTTVAYQLGGERTYAREGAIFVAGAAVQWLRDQLGIVPSAAATAEAATRADASQAVYLVPAFVGLGAPYWDAEARGAIFGLTRATGPNELARAALESVGYQTRDLLEAMRRDGGGGETVLRVDGGMVANDWLMQFLADITGAPVDRPTVLETTALGAAYLAGLAAGVCPPPDQFGVRWRLDARFTPRMDAALRERKYAGWRDAVARTRSSFGASSRSA
jgi:glycerol kinase